MRHYKEFKYNKNDNIIDINTIQTEKGYYSETVLQHALASSTKPKKTS